MAIEYQPFTINPIKPRESQLRAIVENPVARAVGLSMARDSMSSRLPRNSPAEEAVYTSLEEIHTTLATNYEDDNLLCFEGDMDACTRAEEEEQRLMAYINEGNAISNGAIIEQVQKITPFVGPDIVITLYED